MAPATNERRSISVLSLDLRSVMRGLRSRVVAQPRRPRFPFCELYARVSSLWRPFDVAASHRMYVVKWRQERAWVHLERMRRRRVRRVRRGNAGRRPRLRALPADGVRHEVSVEDLIAFDLPDAVLFDVVVLVDAAHPLTVALPLAHDAERTRPHLGALPIGRDVDDGLELHVIVLQPELVVGRLAVQVQVAAHARRAGVDAAHRDLDATRRREDAGQVVPLEVCQVVTVDRVHALELRDVLEQAEAALER